MVAFFTDAAELLGVPKSVAAIYGVIFASPLPIGFAEIEARLELSKGSISQGLKALREMGAVRVCDGDEKSETGGLKPEGPSPIQVSGLKSQVLSASQASGLNPQISSLKSQVSALNSQSSSSAQVSRLSSQVSSRGARRDLYEPDLEMRKLIQRFLQQRIATQLETGKQRLAGLEAGLDQFAAGERRVLQARLNKLARWHTRTRRLLPVVKAFLKI